MAMESTRNTKHKKPVMPGKNIAGKMEVPKGAKKSSSTEANMFAVVRNKKVLEVFKTELAAECYARSCDTVVETKKAVKPGDNVSKCR